MVAHVTTVLYSVEIFGSCNYETFIQEMSLTPLGISSNS